MLDSLFKDPSFITTDGFFLFNGLIYVPSGLRADIFTDNYKNITLKYQGIGKILEKITRNYYFPAIRKYIKKKISEYTEYNRNKILKHVSYE